MDKYETKDKIIAYAVVLGLLIILYNLSDAGFFGDSIREVLGDIFAKILHIG